MKTTDTVLDAIRHADPLDGAEADGWARSVEGLRVLDAVLSESDAGIATPMRRRRSPARLVVGAIAVTGALTGVAAATGVLGGSAPAGVQDDLAGVDAGMPADLRLDPDIDNARAVATSPSATLYAADLPDGGYCIEIVTDGDRPRGAVCLTANNVAAQPIEVTAPLPAGPDSVVVVGGRVNDDRITAVTARYSDGTAADLTMGLERSWLLELDGPARALALQDGLVLEGTAADGTVIATLEVPPLADDDPDGTRYDREQPIFVSTISDGTDLTLVLGIEGSVNIDGVATLELTYPDGTTAPVAVNADGTYTVSIPADRQADFATSLGALVARGSDGSVLATAPVGSVAYWTSTTR
jgi:hypothetical protein